ncbi:FKBP-type peptidyl-prolyl cis-trans isomerase [Luteolibacter pohnpeiensis]|uniref:peptidylprolyl isomerase n=2 Tax=Luteolibacter pohnpeiensis TaxID=454153 RepID=A0A934SBA7_9BACT|nr:FKBP-type peptidyl-prolyl cis-trans isomerase [Luteolibacter pohnpeiensis]
MPETPTDVKAVPADAVKTASGLASKVLQQGTGTIHPAAADTVTVHYSGWTTDGKLFDSSVKRGTPATFPLNQVIPGWTEGLQLMVEGEKRRFWIPANLAYGENPPSGAPAGMLVFDVELQKITQAPKPPAVPEDVAAAPADAEKTESGLASKVLQKGTGTEHPSPEDSVTVDYSGWTTDGKMFDSSVMRGRPATFGVTQVIPGWVEGLQLMVEGEKRRFWIPANLAYGEKTTGGRPAGMLVFDVELHKIVSGPKVPEDVAAAPADAEKTESGIASKVLKKGTGSVHPKATDRVEVHYSGWTTDGKLFDSSVIRGQTATFGLNQVIPGWTEGLQLMVEGEKRRFWIPANLAYGEKPAAGRPGGMLVFDVELFKIK